MLATTQQINFTSKYVAVDKENMVSNLIETSRIEDQDHEIVGYKKDNSSFGT